MASETDMLHLLTLLKDAPAGHLFMLHRMLSTNESVDLTVGVIRPSLKSTWPLFFTIHLLVGVLGLIASISMFSDIIFRKLYRTNTGTYLLNLVINNLFVILLQLPINFIILLYENWVFGRAMCYVAAIIPYLLVHCSVLTFILMSVDRYRSIAHPSKKQLNVLVCLITIWISAVCAATPIVTYMHYRDLSHLNSRLRNNGLCWTTGDDYSKIVFVTIFTLPAVVTALILVKTTAELKTKKELCKLYEAQTRELENKHADTTHSDVDSSAGEDLNEKYKQREWVEKEQTTQRYLTAMTCLWIGCWLPIKIFGTISSNTVETPENEKLFDIALMILLPISAVSTITTPVCFTLMKNKTMPKTDKLYESEERDNKSLMYSSSLRVHDQLTALDARQYI